MDTVNEKHLEFVENNITRMNQCSFQMKGWMITIVSALLAIFAATINSEGKGNNAFIFIAIAPTLLFWILDAMYLSLERKFVDIYNILIGVPTKIVIEINNYEIPVKRIKGWRYCFFNVLCSWSEILLYGLVIAGLVVAGILL